MPVITCPSCQTELPDNAAFCLSCGHAIEQETELKAPNEIDREWLMNVFVSDGYKCEETDESPLLFWARHEERMNASVRLYPALGLFSMASTWALKRSRRDEARVQGAVNTYNSSSLLWTAWIFQDQTTLGMSAIYTFSARTSPQRIKAYLDISNKVFFESLTDTGLIQILQ